MIMNGRAEYFGQVANVQFEGKPLDACRTRIRLGKDFRGDPSAASYLQDCFHAPRLQGTSLIFFVPIEALLEVLARAFVPKMLLTYVCKQK